MKKSDWLVIFWLIGGLGMIGVGVDCCKVCESRQKKIQFIKEQIAALELTDLCLFTESRYTRHPSQSDVHSAFQDHPMALEHFPTGSFLSPNRKSLSHRVNQE